MLTLHHLQQTHDVLQLVLLVKEPNEWHRTLDQLNMTENVIVHLILDNELQNILRQHPLQLAVGLATLKVVLECLVNLLVELLQPVNSFFQILTPEAEQDNLQFDHAYFLVELGRRIQWVQYFLNRCLIID